ncbi:hypothetical protein V6N11_064136 [Hibiscus sabdariffa]|uniref:Uncharacterized protein n=1 Tax=Hibiscus sabdariffa TaxID=183260 RepID=A0ABR2PN36_9ROSI
MTLLMLKSRGDLDANREKFTTASAGIDDSLMLIFKLISLADHFSHMEFLVQRWHCYTSSNALSVRFNKTWQHLQLRWDRDGTRFMLRSDPQTDLFSFLSFSSIVGSFTELIGCVLAISFFPFFSF